MTARSIGSGGEAEQSESPRIRVGQIWRELDPRVTKWNGGVDRYVRIESDRGFPSHVTIRTVTFDGTLWTDAHNSRCSEARVTRFNGKRGGYELHMEAP